MRNHVLAAAFLMTLAAAAPAWASSEAECRAQASGHVAGWKAAGLPAAEIERRWRLATVSCAGTDVDSITAVFMGQMNMDYFRQAVHLVGGAIGSGEYELRLRDRARKRTRARTQPGLLTQWIAGDADGDFVPNALDKCPGTPALEPTDDKGCSSAYRPPGYVDDPLVRRVIDKMGIMRSPACDGAPPVGLPTPLSMSFVAPGELHVVVSRPAGQPAGCPVFYEIMADTEGWVPGTHRYAHVVLRESESVSGNPETAEFHLDWSATGQRRDLMVHFVSSLHTDWQVRAVNGNGLASEYSRLLRSLN
jgi:hypothetical protein